MIKIWSLDNSINDLMVSEIFDDDEIVVRRVETGKIVWEGKYGDWKPENPLKKIHLENVEDEYIYWWR